MQGHRNYLHPQRTLTIASECHQVTFT